MTMFDKFVGKPVALRGIGSGVNVGVCAAATPDGTAVLLEPGSFFCPTWTYDTSKSHGAFHSLANGQVTGGTITLVENDTIVTDVAQIVACDPAVLTVLKKAAKK